MPLIVVFARWYYSQGWSGLFEATVNVLRSVLHRFAVAHHLRTLVSPWHRDITYRSRGFNLKEWVSVYGLNMISRVIGLVLRIVVIAVGLVVFIVTLAIVVILWVFYLFAPVLFALALWQAYLLLSGVLA